MSDSISAVMGQAREIEVRTPQPPPPEGRGDDGHSGLFFLALTILQSCCHSDRVRHPYIHTYMHACIHTYIYIYTHLAMHLSLVWEFVGSRV